MGNRAVITASTAPNAPCIYLHWNGGRDSVEGFLQAAKNLSIKGTEPESFDRLANLLARHFFNCEVGHTVYRQEYKNADADNWDNGVYVIDENFNIVKRIYMRRGEQNSHKSAEIANHIAAKAPIYND
jgi:hypothetical protein